jgi:hypothetical protein
MVPTMLVIKYQYLHVPSRIVLLSLREIVGKERCERFRSFNWMEISLSTTVYRVVQVVILNFVSE